MSTDYRALCAELLAAIDTLTSHGDSPGNLGGRLILTVDIETLEELAARARATLAQPEPAAPTDEELKAVYWEAFKNSAACGAEESWLAGLRAVARWGAPAIQPVAVSERLPGPEELATLVPLMHSGASLCHSEGFYEESDAIGRIADFLEQLMPQAGESTND
jgi:hypothetical protein